MEFHQKLQELRKARGLTQEELAEAIFVSRTAISKWESGRGYPNIDSLKEISHYFSVSIDALLSGDKLVLLAEKENKSNIQNIGNVLFAIVDIFAFLLVLLPLYPYQIESGYIYCVSLFEYANKATIVCWIMYIALILLGIIKIFLTKFKIKKYTSLLTMISIGINIFLVLYLALCRIAYAIVMAFVFFLIKMLLYIKYMK